MTTPTGQWLTELDADDGGFCLDDDRPERDRCIGADCLNPHPDHFASECYTLEMCEAWHAAGEAGGEGPR